MRIPASAFLLSLVTLAALASEERRISAAAWAAAPAAGAPGGQKSDPQSQFVLFGTVFTEQGLALPGAAIRVRRAGEKKVRWEARSDRRGEFGVRVPRGAEYEMSVSAAGYQEHTRKIDARAGSREDLVFRLAPAPGGKHK